MSKTTDAPTFSFTVRVDITTSPATFTIYDESGTPTDAPINIDTQNTSINYSLIDNDQGLVFVTPDISHDPHHDLNPQISSDGQSLHIIDSDADNETICLQLVVAKSSDLTVTYTSPDPQIKNRPPQ